MTTGYGSRFGTSEFIRILVPGFSFAALLWLFGAALPSTAAWGKHVLSGGSAFLLFTFLVLVSGLTMYAKETPKRRKAFVENQPSAYLQNKARMLSETEPLSDDDARRLYFYILNNFMPAGFQEKIFIFGTVYSVMIQIRRTSFWFALLTVVLVGIHIATGTSLAELQNLVLFGVAVSLIYLLNVRYNKADRKMQENYQDQIFWLDMHQDTVKDLLRKRRSYQKHAK